MVESSRMAPPVPAFLLLGGIHIRYKSGGEGEQVVLLHGWGGSMESMDLIFGELLPRYAVTSLDFPGHGKSDLPPAPWSVSDFAEFLLRFMDTLRIQRPHLIAHSFGGRVAIRLAATHPERAGKLILIDSAGIPPPRSGGYRLRVLMGRMGKFAARHGGAWGERLRRRIYAAVGSGEYLKSGPLRETFLKVVNEDLTPLLRRIQSPTLLVWGEKDTDTPPASGRTMERLIPGAELILLKDAGHYSYLDQYGQFRLILGRFLRA
jgi:pimeloyl-ACP methyl ester carboxylesterase